LDDRAGAAEAFATTAAATARTATSFGAASRAAYLVSLAVRRRGWRRRRRRRRCAALRLRRVRRGSLAAAEDRTERLARGAHDVIKVREFLRRRDETERREARVARVREEPVHLGIGRGAGPVDAAAERAGRQRRERAFRLAHRRRQEDRSETIPLRLFDALCAQLRCEVEEIALDDAVA